MIKSDGAPQADILAICIIREALGLVLRDRRLWPSDIPAVSFTNEIDFVCKRKMINN